MIQEKLVLVGRISAAYSLKGQVIVMSYTHIPDNLFNLPLVNDKYESLLLTKVRQKSTQSFICNVSTCTDRSQAELLIGTQLFCLRTNLPKPDLNEYYFYDLVGLDVLNQQYEKIGIILALYNFGAGDLIEVQFTNASGLNNSDSQIFPFTEDFFPQIDQNFVVLKAPNTMY